MQTNLYRHGDVMILSKKDFASIDVGDGKGLLVHLAGRQGIAHFYRVGDRVTFAECFCDDHKDPLYLEWIAAKPSPKATRCGAVISAKKLAFLPTTDVCTDDDAMVLPMKGTFALLVEPEVTDAWGSGRRAHLVPAK